METDIIILVKTDFRIIASRIFATVYDAFKKAVSKLDRRRDENVFQQILGKHRAELKRQLTETVHDIVNRYRDTKEVNALHAELSTDIIYYISEFNLKTKSM